MNNKVKLKNGQYLYEVDNIVLTQTVKHQLKKHFMFLIDVSGSMYYQLDSIKQHLSNNIATSLNSGDLLSIIYYSSNGDYGHILNKFEYVDIDSLNAAKNSLKMLSARSLTGFCDPLRLAHESFSSDETNVLVFMSDGYENQNSKNSVLKETRNLAEKVDYGMVIEYGDYANHELLVEMGSILGSTVYANNVQSYNTKVVEVIGGTFNSNFCKISSKGVNQIFYIHEGLTVVPSLNEESDYLIPENQKFYVLSNESDLYPFELSKISDFKGILGLIYLNNSNTSFTYDLLSDLGSIYLIEKYSTSFGKQKINSFLNDINLSLSDKLDIFEKGTDYNYLPSSDQFCLFDLLDILSSDKTTKVYTRDSRFIYNRIGAKKVQASSLLESPYTLDFNYTDQIESGNKLDLVYNKSRANISFRVKHNVNVNLEKVNQLLDNNQAPSEVDSFIYRNYTMVNDMILNIKKLVISTSEETLAKIDSKYYEVIDGRVILNLEKMPISNRDMIENVDIKNLASYYVGDHLLAYRQKVFNSLSKQHEAKKLNNIFIELYGEEIANYLKDLGLTPYNGFSPKTTLTHGQDMYYAPAMKVKFENIGTIPSLASVIKKIENKGVESLSIRENMIYNVYKEYLDLIDSPAYKNSVDSKTFLLNYISVELNSIRKSKRLIMGLISQNVFSLFLAKTLIDEESYKVDTQNGTYSVLLDQIEQEIKM